jgi:hypothetical protein
MKLNSLLRAARFVAFSAVLLHSSLFAFTEYSIDYPLRSEMPQLQITTTIAAVNFQENEMGELSEISVLADTDNRVFFLNTQSSKEVNILMAAQNNGWHVSLSLELKMIDGQAVYYISQVEILSRENQLSVGGQTPAVNLAPMVARNRTELNRWFNSIYHYDGEIYDVSDDCYNRAHYWSRTLEHNRTLQQKEERTDKIFILFSRNYSDKFKHKWWYHVAPVVYLHNDKNPMVFDSTFIPEPVTLRDWLKAFDSHTDGQCKKIESLEEYLRENDKGTPICMYIVSSMYSYIPSDLVRGRSPRNWRCRDFNMVKQFSAPYSKTLMPGIRWTNKRFDYLLPNHCR